MSLLKKVRNITRIGFASLATLLLISHIRYTNNVERHEKNPSELRQEFEKDTGFPIIGYTEDIEDDAGRILFLKERILREQKERKFGLEGIIIESEDITKQGGLDPLAKIFFKEILGRYNYLTDKITLTKKYDLLTIVHEIKHAKAREIEKENPGFLNEWAKIATDNQGKSLYIPNKTAYLSRFKGIDNLAPTNKRSQKDNLIQGFVSDYAATNVGEDIAELCMVAEIDPTFLAAEVKNGNKKITDKIRLAEKYCLISRDKLKEIYSPKEPSQ